MAEFPYSPAKCDQTYRIIVLHKQVSVAKRQRKLIDDSPYFFYITNVSQAEKSADEIVLESNKRCDQENIISQGKQMGAFAAPLHTTLSNGAYMVMLRESGRPQQKTKLKAEKHRLLRMDVGMITGGGLGAFIRWMSLSKLIPYCLSAPPRFAFAGICKSRRT